MSKKYNYKELIETQLPHKAYKSQDMESSILGNIFNKLQKSTDELELNINPATALEDGLTAWEDFLKISVNDKQNFNIRRDIVLAELIQYLGDESVITKDEMETIVRLYGGNPEILEYPKEYTFYVNYKYIKDLDLPLINNVIRRIKPSYLKHNLSFIRNENLSIKEEHSLLPVKFDMCGEVKTKDRLVHSNALNIAINEDYFKVRNVFKQAGTFKSKDVQSQVQTQDISIKSEYIKLKQDYPICGSLVCGGGII